MKTWHTKEWKEKRDAFLEGKSCSWECKNPINSNNPLVIDHLIYLNPDGSAMTEADYMDFEKNAANNPPLCKRCAFARKKKLVLCQVCRVRYHRKRDKYRRVKKMCNHCDPDNVLCKKCEKVYHPKEYEMCYACNKKEQKKRRKK